MLMKRTPILTLAIVAGAALLISVAIFRGYLPYTGRPLLPKQPPAVVIAMDDTYLVGVGSKGKLWSIKARKVEISQNRSTTTLTGISDGRIFDRGKPMLSVKAGRAVYDTYYRDLQLGGGVLIQGGDGQKLSGTGASWNSATALLRSTGQVRFESGWGQLTAGEMTVDVRNRQMLMRDVGFKVRLKEAL